MWWGVVIGLENQRVSKLSATVLIAVDLNSNELDDFCVIPQILSTAKLVKLPTHLITIQLVYNCVKENFLDKTAGIC
jgi:hypothetical protein